MAIAPSTSKSATRTSPSTSTSVSTTPAGRYCAMQTFPARARRRARRTGPQRIGGDLRPAQLERRGREDDVPLRRRGRERDADRDRDAEELQIERHRDVRRGEPDGVGRESPRPSRAASAAGTRRATPSRSRRSSRPVPRTATSWAITVTSPVTPPNVTSSDAMVSSSRLPPMSCGITAPATSTSISWSAGSDSCVRTWSRTTPVTTWRAIASAANHAATASTATMTKATIQGHARRRGDGAAPAGSMSSGSGSVACVSP